MMSLTHSLYESRCLSVYVQPAVSPSLLDCLQYFWHRGQYNLLLGILLLNTFTLKMTCFKKYVLEIRTEVIKEQTMVASGFHDKSLSSCRIDRYHKIRYSLRFLIHLTIRLIYTYMVLIMFFLAQCIKPFQQILL